MKIQIKTSTGVEAIISQEVSSDPRGTLLPRLEIEGRGTTANFAFINPALEEMVHHFLTSEDTDFAVGIGGGAKSITTAVKPSLLSVRFKASNNITPLGELDLAHMPEITSSLIVSFQKPEDHIQTGAQILTITDFEILGTIVEIKLIQE